jgi:hypothetical protein
VLINLNILNYVLSAISYKRKSWVFLMSSTTVGSNNDIQPELTLASNNGMDTTVNEAMDQPLHKIMVPSIDASPGFESNPLITIPPATIVSHLEFAAEDAATVAAATPQVFGGSEEYPVCPVIDCSTINVNSIRFLTG